MLVLLFFPKHVISILLRCIGTLGDYLFTRQKILRRDYSRHNILLGCLWLVRYDLMKFFGAVFDVPCVCHLASEALWILFMLL